MEAQGQSLHRQVAAHFVALALALGYKTCLKTSVDGAQHQLADAQSTLLALKGRFNYYRSFRSIDEQGRGGWRRSSRSS